MSDDPEIVTTGLDAVVIAGGVVSILLLVSGVADRNALVVFASLVLTAWIIVWARLGRRNMRRKARRSHLEGD